MCLAANAADALACFKAQKLQQQLHPPQMATQAQHQQG